MRISLEAARFGELGLEEWREVDTTKPGAKTSGYRWFQLGRFYQTLSSAVGAAYELALKKNDGKVGDIKNALKHAESIKREMLEAIAGLESPESGAVK